jgi:cytochrome P450 family 4 subfamily V
VFIKRAMSPWLYNDFIFRLTKTGREHDRLLKILHEFTEDVSPLASGFACLPFKPNCLSLEQIIRKRLSSYEATYEENGKRVAFLDVLLKEHKADPKRFTLQDVKEEVDLFMFAGHDTTTSALLMAFHAVSQNPAIQSKIREEIDSVLGMSRLYPVQCSNLSLFVHSEGDFNGGISLEQLHQMNYLEMVIKVHKARNQSIHSFRLNAKKSC